jgi:hypothetical protein
VRPPGDSSYRPRSGRSFPQDIVLRPLDRTPALAMTTLFCPERTATITSNAPKTNPAERVLFSHPITQVAHEQDIPATGHAISYENLFREPPFATNPDHDLEPFQPDHGRIERRRTHRAA